MQDWLSPQTLGTMAGAVVAVAVAWGNLRTTVMQQAKQHALEREEIRAISKGLRADIDELRTRNGSPRVMDALARAATREDDADKRALLWIPVITAMASEVKGLEKEMEGVRKTVVEMGSLVAEIKARQEVQRRQRT
jgi:hypothetical protein